MVADVQLGCAWTEIVVHGVMQMQVLWQDVRYALRQLARSLGFTATAVLSLTFGIAATTAVFSVVWAVLMNPYPYANSDRMAHLALGALSDSGGYNGFGSTAMQWQQIRAQPGVEDAVWTDEENLTITGQDLPENVDAEYFSSNGFQFFGVPALLGRGILPSDAVGGADPEPVVVLGYKFWQRRFGGDGGIVGKTIQLSRKTYTVVGVVAPRFTWGDADLYLPAKITAKAAPAGNVELRLKPGVTHRMLEQQMQPLITQFAKETPAWFPPKPGPLHVIGLNEQFLKALGPTLALLFGAVALLLAIGCGNVSILLLARGMTRQHEFALRAAIGASRGRIVRQLLTESLLLSVTGAVLGTLLAYRLLSVIVGLLPANSFPHEAAIAINTPVLVFSVLVALATGLLFGLSPALRLSRPDVREAMQAGARRVAGGAGIRRTSNALIAGQIALTLLMMSTAGVAIQSFLKLARLPLGYDPHNVMSVGLPLRMETYQNMASRGALVEALRNKIAETPGVKEVAVSSNATPPGSGFNVPMQVLGQTNEGQQMVRWNLVSAEYFPLLHVPLLRGRLWTPSEIHHAAHLAVVNQAFVRRYFANGDAIGHSVKTGFLKPEPPAVVTAAGSDDWMQIVGVTADKVNDGLRGTVVPEVSVPYTMGMGPYSQLLVRTDGPPLALLHAIGLRVAQVDGEQQISGQVRDLEHWISHEPEYARGQLVSWLFGGFALLALALAAVGLYSVVSYTVAQRTNEFGIRMALGALRADVLELVFRSTALSVGAGLLVGVALSLALRQVMAHVTGGSAKDAWALTLAMLVLCCVALVASGIPARRAARIEPMEALRWE